jgi:hypothetical protein
MKPIPLHNRKGEIVGHTIVDDEDYEGAMRHSWSDDGQGYPVTQIAGRHVRMHHYIGPDRHRPMSQRSWRDYDVQTIQTFQVIIATEEQWADPDSNPPQDIEAGKIAIVRATQREANRLVLTNPSWRALARHPLVKDGIKHLTLSRSGAVSPFTMEDISRRFDIEQVVMESTANYPCPGVILMYVEEPIILEKQERS